MKNLIKLTEKQDIHDFFLKLWQTDIVRQSHENKGIVYQLVEDFAILPRFVYDATDPYAEYAHFSIWWGGILLRDNYDNPACHDLYFLHDLAHGADMTYAPDLTPVGFRCKQGRNELYASVMSEIYLYFALPGLRQLSFEHDIYADRFLNDPILQQLYQDNPDYLFKFLLQYRHDALVKKQPQDACEQWIQKFRDNNASWFSIWKDRYNTIETAMHHFFLETQLYDRKTALDHHIEWLRSSDVLGAKGIPFEAEAYAFAETYHNNVDKKAAA